MKHIVKLQWITPENGGRQSPPTGPKYSTVARFFGKNKILISTSWSLVIEFTEPPDNALSHIAFVSFLANGPEVLLEPTTTFELLEGSRPVANGIVMI
jgi:hypothetical protein